MILENYLDLRVKANDLIALVDSYGPKSAVQTALNLFQTACAEDGLAYQAVYSTKPDFEKDNPLFLFPVPGEVEDAYFNLKSALDDARPFQDRRYALNYH